MISSNKYPTEDLLKVLSDKKSAQIISILINKGLPIGSYLEKLGLRSKSMQESIDDYELLNQDDIINGTVFHAFSDFMKNYKCDAVRESNRLFCRARA